MIKYMLRGKKNPYSHRRHTISFLSIVNFGADTAGNYQCMRDLVFCAAKIYTCCLITVAMLFLFVPVGSHLMSERYLRAEQEHPMHFDEVWRSSSAVCVVLGNLTYNIKSWILTWIVL